MKERGRYPISPVPGTTGGGEDGWLPLQLRGIDLANTLGLLFLEALLVLLDDLVRQDDDPVSFLLKTSVTTS